LLLWQNRIEFDGSCNYIFRYLYLTACDPEFCSVDDVVFWKVIIIMENSTITAWVIVNQTIKQKTFPLECLDKTEAGYIFVDDYGMGACHWSVINHPEDAEDRQMADDVLWAKDRMNFAMNESQEEIPGLQQIIKTNGYTRSPETLKALRNWEEAIK